MAAALLEKERPERIQKVRIVKDLVYHGLIEGNDLLHLNGSLSQSLPNIIDFSVDGMESPVLLIALDRQGIAVSAGSACEAGAVEPSHVLMAMGVGEKWLRSSIRMSFGPENTTEEIYTVIQAIQDITRSLRKGERL